MLRKVLYLMLGMLVLLACKENTYVIPKEQMVDVLTEMHLAESILYNDTRKFNKKELKLEVYNHVFKKYDISKERLDSSIRYYVVHAPVFNDIYDEVVKRLDTMLLSVEKGDYLISQEFLFTELDGFIQSTDKNEKDSVVTEVWRLQRDYSLPQDGAKNTIDFSFENDTTNKFDFVVLKAEIMLFYNDCSDNPKVQLRMDYTDGTHSKTDFPLYKNSVAKNIRLRLNKDAGKVVSKIQGELISHNKCLSSKKANISNVRLYKMKYPKRVELKKNKTLDKVPTK